MNNSGFLTIEQRNELKSIARKPSEMCGVTRRNHYLEGGLDKLSSFDWQGGQSRLTQAQEAELTDHLDQKLQRDCKEIGAHIREKYDVHYSHSGTIKLMDRLGFDYKPPSRIRAQTDADSTIALLTKIEVANPTKTAIHVFLDNARYHHARTLKTRAVKNWLKSTNSCI